MIFKEENVMKEINDDIKLTGYLVAEVFDPSGRRKSIQIIPNRSMKKKPNWIVRKLMGYKEIPNTVTTAGKAHVVDQLAAAPAQAKMTKMEIGTGTGGTTALHALIATWGTMNLLTRTASGAVLTSTCLFTSTQDGITVTESGILNSANIMMNYVDTLVQLLNTGDTLSITWNTTAS